MLTAMLAAPLAAAAFTASTFVATDEEATEAAMGTGFADSFWVVAALFVVVALLGLDMVRRLRRAKNREEIQAELAPELEALRAAQAAGVGAVDGAGPAGGVADDAGPAGGSAAAAGSDAADAGGTDAPNADAPERGAEPSSGDEPSGGTDPRP